MMTTENVVNNLADHVAVRHVVDRYTDALNVRDWGTLGSLFTNEAVWVAFTPTGEVQAQVEGQQHEIGGGIRELVESTGGGQVVQMNHATNIHVAGDRATARSTMESTHWMPDGARKQMFAMYDDNLVREQDGEWRFERREWRTKVMFDLGPA
jgi:uncharacterized protein (TIGR02246 family)